MSGRRRRHAAALALLATIGLMASAARADDDDDLPTGFPYRDRARASPWSLGMDSGVALRHASVQEDAYLFARPLRPIIDVYAHADVLTGSRLRWRLGFGWELDGLLPTRSLLVGINGQPGVRTMMFTNEFFLVPLVVRWTPWLEWFDWLHLIASIRGGLALSTLEYSSDADRKVFSRTAVDLPITSCGGILFNLSPRIELLAQVGYRIGFNKAELYLKDDHATLPSDPRPFVSIDRSGLLMTVGFAYRP